MARNATRSSRVKASLRQRSRTIKAMIHRETGLRRLRRSRRRVGEADAEDGLADLEDARPSDPEGPRPR